MSRRRAARRRDYAAYLASAQWQYRRRAWLEGYRLEHEADPICAVCGTPWTLDEDLHHASYSNLGHERDQDLIPMDRAYHEALHQILDRSRAWRAMPRSAATAGIVAVLRALRRATAG
jgi:hypothetical protein